MMGTPVLLFPDTGEAFLRSLRMAALYSEDVRVLTVLDRRFAESMSDAFADIGPNDPVLARRLADYFRFISSASADLDTLAREGILKPVIADEEGSWEPILQSRGPAVDRMREISRSALDEAIWQRVMAQVGEAFDDFTPCLADLDMLSVVVDYLEGDRTFDVTTISDQKRLHSLLFLRYLVQVIIMSETLGVPTLSWSLQWQRALWAVRALLPSTGQESEQHRVNRALATADLAHNILERHLPTTDDLPIEDLLALRLKRRAELDSLRVAIRQLATEVDITVSPQEIQTQVCELVASRVDPALDDVRRAIATSRLDVFKRLGRSSASLATATFSVSVAVAAGAPLDIAAAVGTIGGILGVMLENKVERLRLTRASQWGFLFNLPAKRRAGHRK